MSVLRSQPRQRTSNTCLYTFTCMSVTFFLSTKLASLKLENYTRECEFWNFDKTKNKNNQKKQQKKKQKNFWLNFCLNKECPKLLCGLDIGHRRRQTIPMWNSSGEKEFFRASLYV